MIIDDATGEVVGGTTLEFVTLDLHSIDEAAEMFPTPQQCAAALIHARRVIDEAPRILAQRSAALKEAQKVLTVALDYAGRRAIGRDAYTRRLAVLADPEVLDAQQQVDICAVALEFAKDRRKSLSEDIDILRSLNANFRGEHS